MEKVHVIYGSTTGMTEAVAAKVAVHGGRFLPPFLLFLSAVVAYLAFSSGGAGGFA